LLEIWFFDSSTGQVYAKQQPKAPEPLPSPPLPRSSAIDVYPTRIYAGNEVSQQARILSKPEAQYTEEARKNRITGTVVLRAIFTTSGQVSSIRAVSGLPFGLTERAIAAARQIKFSPATKDGHPVSQWQQVEYNFFLY
jgi:TonB family protein